MSDVTQTLTQIETGDGRAAEQLLPLVYTELRRLAAAKMATEPSCQTLQATALVHEAYLRLVDQSHPQTWKHRGHFFCAAAEAMRRILVERARSRAAQRRGGEAIHQPLDESAIAQPDPPHEMLAVHDALDALAAIDPLSADLFKLRYFVGFTMNEAAAPWAYLPGKLTTPGLTPVPGCAGNWGKTSTDKSCVARPTCWPCPPCPYGSQGGVGAYTANK